jgi:UDP-N-acetylglucosamine 1-carboxyvinyltransferase
MQSFVIEGGHRLSGNVRINGAKNSALPLMAAALLTPEPVTLRDVPPLADIHNLLRLLTELGCHRTLDELGERSHVLRLQSIDERGSHAPYEIVRTMRAGICVLGPLLARRGEARVSLPGGCAIGERPIDLHLRGLTAMGARITLENGDVVGTVPGGRLRGARIFLGGPFGSTVLGTANIMSAATLAEGKTIIESAACEPEIVDLANLLRSMGADIEGDGSPRIIVRGVKELCGADHRIIPDRIEAGTFMCAAAISRGNLIIENCPLDALMAVTDRLEAMGVRLRTLGSDGRRIAEPEDPMRAVVQVTTDWPLCPVEITTQPHPGFPTDLQAQLLVMLCLAEGNSVVTEKIFPERFLHVAELSRMGAKIFRQGPTVVVSGTGRLVGAPVMASDLRASASLVLAGLAAEGTTTINRVYHLDRGYERMEDRLNVLGARIRRVDEREVAEVARETAA